MTTRKTFLYDNHLQSQAKMVNFGGWEMPLHYGSQVEEHHQVRRSAGVFDVSHMTIVDLSGAQVFDFLRYLLANNVVRLKTPGKALYSCMLNEQGGVIDDLIVYYQDNHHYRLVVNAATREKDLAWITQQAKPFAIQIKQRDDLAMLAVQGPLAREKVYNLLSEKLKNEAMALAPFHATWNNDDWFIGRTGYTGEDGFEIMLPGQQASDFWQALTSSGVSPIGLGARDTLRLEAGMSLYGADMDENYTPLESALGWTVAWAPPERNFIGRQALEAQKQQADHKIMVGLILLSKGVLRAHQTVLLETGEQGEITSGTFSPTLGVAIAFARLPAGTYTQVNVAIREKLYPAQVVKPPYVRHGKACVDLPKP